MAPMQSPAPIAKAPRWRSSLIALVMALCLIGTGFLFFDVQRKIYSRGTAASDTMQWTLAQMDVEYQTLRSAMLSAELNRVTLDEVRQRYDVLVSRIGILSTGKVFGMLQQDPEYDDALKQVIGWIEGMQPEIDGPDDALRAALRAMTEATEAQRLNVRALTLGGLRVFAEMADKERAAVATTLLLAGGIAAVLIVVLITMVAVQMILERSTRRITAEKLETLERLQAIIASALDAVIIADASNSIETFNTSAGAVFGMDAATAIGRDLAQVTGLSGPLGARAVGLGRQRMTARHATGRSFPVEISITKVTAQGQDLFVAFLRDLSAVVAHEQEMVMARDEARAGERAKAQLLAVMSHEMRTPLNGMIGMMEVLGHGDLGPEAQAHLGVMQTSAQLLAHHVDDVLTIAQVDAGQMPNQNSAVDLAALAQDLFANQRSAAEAMGNTLALDIADETAATIWSDSFQLRQVLTNLLGNAIKFTRNGAITLRISPEAGGAATRIEVIDSGIGIDPADHARVFDDFVILDASYSRLVGGTGLGLGITRRIVQNMGGAIWAEGALGQGSRFIVTLPAPLGRAAPPIPESGAGPLPPAPLPPMTVLLVEDNSINRLVVCELLQRQGHRITEALNGHEGVAQAAITRFDLILMDISMPQMDGEAATRAIRTGDGLSRDTPIVALTAHVLDAELARFRAAGMQDVLRKPTTGRELARVLGLYGLNRADPAPNPPVRQAGILDQGILDEVLEGTAGQRGQKLTLGFIAEIDAELPDLAALAQSPKSRPALRRAAHRMCGSAAIFGASALATALRQLDAACLAEKEPEVAMALAEVIALWPPTRAAVQARLARDIPAAASNL